MQDRKLYPQVSLSCSNASRQHPSCNPFNVRLAFFREHFVAFLYVFQGRHYRRHTKYVTRYMEEGEGVTD